MDQSDPIYSVTYFFHSPCLILYFAPFPKIAASSKIGFIKDPFAWRNESLDEAIMHCTWRGKEYVVQKGLKQFSNPSCS